MAFKNIKDWIATRKKPAPQHFGNPKIIRAGQELDIRSWIDSAREDTELYKTLEKYGCIDRMIVNTESVYGDMTKIMDLRDSLEQIKKADELWESLPLDFRKEYLNDKTIFMREGLERMKAKIEKEKPQPVEQPKETVEQPITEGDK